MTQNRYCKDTVKETLKIYAFIATKHPGMISEGFTAAAIQMIVGFQSLLLNDEHANLAVEEYEDFEKPPFFTSTAAKAPRIRAALAEKIPLVPLTRLGIYYISGIDGEICDEEAGRWLENETHGEELPFDIKGDDQRYHRYGHLELLLNMAEARGNEHEARQVELLRDCMEELFLGWPARALNVLQQVYALTRIENNRHPVTIEILQYCAELFLDCGEPRLALKCFLRFARRIRKDENFIYKLYLGMYEVRRDGSEAELRSDLIAKLIARLTKALEKRPQRGPDSLYKRLRSRVPVFSQKYRQCSGDVCGSRVLYN